MKQFFGFFLLLGVLSFGACHKHDDHNHPVDISFINLTEGQVFPIGNVTIGVRFSTEHELHDVKVRLVVDETNAAVAPFPIDRHSHRPSLEITETVDLSSFAAGTRFRLEAEACRNHDCSEKDSRTLRFSLAQ